MGFRSRASSLRMEVRSISLLLLALLLHALFLSVAGMRFDLHSGDTKCFAEELIEKSLVLGNYHVVSENAPNISAKVSTPYGSPKHFHERVSEGEFAFNADEEGNYMVCFWMPDAPKGTQITIEFSWKTGVAAKDWATIAKRERIDGIELELRKLEDSVQEIHDDMLYLRDREAEMRKINEVTNSRMGWFSFTSLSMCLLVAGLQLWYLKSFFERKKIL